MNTKQEIKNSMPKEIPNKNPNKTLRLVEGYYKAQPLGNGNFKLKSIGQYKQYSGIYKLEQIDGKYHYYRQISKGD